MPERLRLAGKKHSRISKRLLMICAICKAPMRPDVLIETYRCPACGFYASTLPVKINQVRRIDEINRERALQPLRSMNFSRILADCADLLPSGANVLDVGCAHGWFLDAANSAGYRCTGIDPDYQIAARARAAGHTVIDGLFPDAMLMDQRYDIITFHDVLEHLPQIDQVVAQLSQHLNDGGLTIVNLPVSDGLIFRLTRALARAVKINGPYRAHGSGAASHRRI